MAAIAAADRACDAATAVQVQADEIEAEIRIHTDGSTAEKPAEAIVRLQQAKVRLDEAKVEFAAGSAAAEEYIAHLEGNSGGVGVSPVSEPPASGSSRPPPPPPTPPPPTGDPAGPPPRPDMKKAGEIRPHVGIRKTVGRLVVNGVDSEGEIWSGKAGPGRGGPGLAAPWRHMETMTEHVEGHVAAVMRRDEIADAQLYISRRPCEELPYGCRWTLEDALPADSRLTVFTVDRRGGVKPRLFVGNGRGRNSDDATS